MLFFVLLCSFVFLIMSIGFVYVRTYCIQCYFLLFTLFLCCVLLCSFVFLIMFFSFVYVLFLLFPVFSSFVMRFHVVYNYVILCCLFCSFELFIILFCVVHYALLCCV